MTVDADRQRARYSDLRAKNRCTHCGGKLIGVDERAARCPWCKQAAASYYQRRSPAAAEHRIAADRARHAQLKGTATAAAYRTTAHANRKARVAETGCCLECSRPAAPRRERCIRHLQRARKRARDRRAAARATT